MSEPTEAYTRALKATQAYHARKQGKTFSGAFMFKDQRHRLAEICQRYSVETMLDYGCGYGQQYDMREGADGKGIKPNEPGFDPAGRSLFDILGLKNKNVTRYDPGIPNVSAEPVGKFDLVACVQVLGCVPTADLPWVIDRLYGFATKAVFVAERIGAPHKAIHDHMAGEMPRNTSAEEWLERLRRPGSPIRLFFAAKNPQWELIEPENQG